MLCIICATVILSSNPDSLYHSSSSLFTSGEPEGADVCAMLLTAFSLMLVLVTLPFSLCVSVKVSLNNFFCKCMEMVTYFCSLLKVVQEYERAVVFRLGRLRSGGAKGPGLFFIMPCVDSYKKVDLRTVSFDVPPQEVCNKMYWNRLFVQ